MTDRKPSSRATGRVTLQDVAAQAGVSPITASRALRGMATVAPELVARVQAAVQRLGYVPDPAARALASGSRSAQVVVLLPMLAGHGWPELFEALHGALWAAGYQTLIGVTHGDAATEERLLRACLLQRPAGIVVAGAGRGDVSEALLAASGAPCVRLTEASSDQRVHSVGVSHCDAGDALARHLVERGRKRIALVASERDPRMPAFVEGYRRCLRNAELYDARREVLLDAPDTVAAGAEVFEELRQRQRATDGIVYGSDALAQGGLLAALRLNVRVPLQIAVVGLGDADGSEQSVPPLTSAHVPYAEIGTEAAHLLLALMRGEQPAVQAVNVGFELKVRESS